MGHFAANIVRIVVAVTVAAHVFPGYALCLCSDGCFCREPIEEPSQTTESCCASTATATECEVVPRASDGTVIESSCCGSGTFVDTTIEAALPPSLDFKSASPIAHQIDDVTSTSSNGRIAAASPRGPPTARSAPLYLLVSSFRL